MARGHHKRARGGRHEDQDYQGSGPEMGQHYADGGNIIPEERGGDDLDYTNESNVVKEAKGARRARGGHVVDHHRTGEHTAHHHRTGHRHRTGHPSELHLHEHHHEHLRRGGAAKKKKEVESEGHRDHRRRLDRPGRKRGGGVGADRLPLTTAARGTDGGFHKTSGDELAE